MLKHCNILSHTGSDTASAVIHHIAAKGCIVDQPRNLAKSVTVE
jgi:hypothetical protein